MNPSKRPFQNSNNNQKAHLVKELAPNPYSQSKKSSKTQNKAINDFLGGLASCESIPSHNLNQGVRTPSSIFEPPTLNLSNLRNSLLKRNMSQVILKHQTPENLAPPKNFHLRSQSRSRVSSHDHTNCYTFRIPKKSSKCENPKNSKNGALELSKGALELSKGARLSIGSRGSRSNKKERPRSTQNRHNPQSLRGGDGVNSWGSVTPIHQQNFKFFRFQEIGTQHSLNQFERRIDRYGTPSSFKTNFSNLRANLDGRRARGNANLPKTTSRSQFLAGKQTKGSLKKVEKINKNDHQTNKNNNNNQFRRQSGRPQRILRKKKSKSHQKAKFQTLKNLRKNENLELPFALNKSQEAAGQFIRLFASLSENSISDDSDSSREARSVSSSSSCSSISSESVKNVIFDDKSPRFTLRCKPKSKF